MAVKNGGITRTDNAQQHPNQLQKATALEERRVYRQGKLERMGSTRAGTWIVR